MPFRTTLTTLTLLNNTINCRMTTRQISLCSSFQATTSKFLSFPLALPPQHTPQHASPQRAPPASSGSREYGSPMLLPSSRPNESSSLNLLVQGGIIAFISLSVLYFFTLDMKNEIKQEIQTQNRQKQDCQREYIENQCHDPVESVIQYCRDMALCAQRDADISVRYTARLAKLLGASLRTLLVQLQTYGIICIICALLAVSCCKCHFVWERRDHHPHRQIT